MVAKPLYPLYKNIIKPLDRVRYPELRYFLNLFIRSIRLDFFQMLENSLIRFLESAVALASLPAIEFFGSIEQRPTPHNSQFSTFN